MDSTFAYLVIGSPLCIIATEMDILNQGARGISSPNAFWPWEQFFWGEWQAQFKQYGWRVRESQCEVPTNSFINIVSSKAVIWKHF